MPVAIQSTDFARFGTGADGGRSSIQREPSQNDIDDTSATRLTGDRDQSRGFASPSRLGFALIEGHAVGGARRRSAGATHDRSRYGSLIQWRIRGAASRRSSGAPTAVDRLEPHPAVRLVWLDTQP